LLSGKQYFMQGVRHVGVMFCQMESSLACKVAGMLARWLDGVLAGFLSVRLSCWLDGLPASKTASEPVRHPS